MSSDQRVKEPGRRYDDDETRPHKLWRMLECALREEAEAKQWRGGQKKESTPSKWQGVEDLKVS